MNYNEHCENQVAGLRKILWWSLLCIPSATIFAPLFHVPVSFFACPGFVSIFAAKVPFACTILAGEPSGSQHIAYYAMAFLVAYVLFLVPLKRKTKNISSKTDKL